MNKQDLLTFIGDLDSRSENFSEDDQDLIGQIADGAKEILVEEQMGDDLFYLLHHLVQDLSPARGRPMRDNIPLLYEVIIRVIQKFGQNDPRGEELTLRLNHIIGRRMGSDDMSDSFRFALRANDNAAYKMNPFPFPMKGIVK